MKSHNPVIKKHHKITGQLDKDLYPTDLIIYSSQIHLSVTNLYNIFYKFYNYLPPVAEGRGREIIKCLLYVCASVRLSRFYINLNILFIYKDIFTKFPGNVYGYKNMSVQKFGLILKNKMATITD